MENLRYKEITECRICKNTNIVPVLHLGNQALTGVFPKSKEKAIISGPLELVKCLCKDDGCCGLVQLKQSYDSSEMYGENYGYRSGLNSSMVRHLQSIVTGILNIVDITANDIIVDIGSNDGTTLSLYPNKESRYIGIDPTAMKFKAFYQKHIEIIPDFFSAKLINEKTNGKKVKVVTSIAMFYDLEEPMQFIQNIYDILDENGIWVFEQSYVKTMIEQNAYDTVCHEHIEFYALKQIKWMLDRKDMKIIAIDINDTNGGSFRLTVAKKGSKLKECAETIAALLQSESSLEHNSLAIFKTFEADILKHKNQLVALLTTLKNEHKCVLGYGASTKGNVILQYCNITKDLLPAIADVNPDKFGSFTPHTNIPIISEEAAKAMDPDYFLVFPWHFRKNILEREKAFRANGGKFIFPLPYIEIV